MTLSVVSIPSSHGPICKKFLPAARPPLHGRLDRASEGTHRHAAGTSTGGVLRHVLGGIGRYREFLAPDGEVEALRNERSCAVSACLCHLEPGSFTFCGNDSGAAITIPVRSSRRPILRPAKPRSPPARLG